MVSKPVAARGFMSGRGPEVVRCTGEREGRSERSERRVWAPMLPAARVANGVAARGSEGGRLGEEGEVDAAVVAFLDKVGMSGE